MSSATSRRMPLRRVAPGRFRATAQSGAHLDIGDSIEGDEPTFSPVELLLAALGACTAIDVDTLTSRRSEPNGFDVLVEADKIRDEQGNRLVNLSIRFEVTFPDGEAGDQARAVLPDAVRRSHDLLCTVGRTIETGTPVGTSIAG